MAKKSKDKVTKKETEQLEKKPHRHSRSQDRANSEGQPLSISLATSLQRNLISRFFFRYKVLAFFCALILLSIYDSTHLFSYPRFFCPTD